MTIKRFRKVMSLDHLGEASNFNGIKITKVVAFAQIHLMYQYVNLGQECNTAAETEQSQDAKSLE